MNKLDLRFERPEQYGTYGIIQVERYEKQINIRDSYNYGKVDETISRIEKKLEDICNELKSLTTILENCNGK